MTGGELLDGSVGDGSASDVVPDYVTYDAIDLDVNTAICDGGFALSDAAVWVSASAGSDSSSCGDQSTPCKTIAQAIANLDGRNAIYLDDSTFNEAVAITTSSLTLQGGFQRDAGWTPVCRSNLTTIQAPDDASVAIEITGANATLRLLTVQSKVNGAAGTGETVYAVRATNAGTLTIDNCSLLAQNGGAGAWGSAGSTPSGCTPGGSNGADGSVGAAGTPGTFVGNAFVTETAQAGTSGQSGSSSKGAFGTCALCSSDCLTP